MKKQQLKSQKRQKNQRTTANSILISNDVKEVPNTLNKVVTKSGYKVISRGTDNLLPYTISDIIKGSSTLSNIIYSKAEYVSSGDLITEDPALLKKLTEDLNKDYNWKELSKRVSIDYNAYGYAFIERVRIGSEIFLYHLSTDKVCYQEYENELETVLISKDWRYINKKENTPYQLSVYPMETKDEEAEIFRSVLLVTDYDIDISVYGLPKWIGAFYDAQSESLIGQYNANQFENGISLSSILSIDLGDVVDETDLQAKKRKFEREIKGTSGASSGKSLIIPTSGGIEKPEYTIYPMEKEGSFAKLQETIENNIVKANQWFRSLAGLQTAGSLGNNQQLKNEWALAERQITNIQNKIMSTVLDALEIDAVIDFSNDNPIDVSTEIDINEVLTIDEKRALLGYKPLENNDSK